MNEKHSKIEFKLAVINNQIKRLEELLSLTSSIRMQANIRLKIYELEKERYILNKILNFKGE
jgi:hypothetical protein